LIWLCRASACPEAIAADVAWLADEELERDAAMATASAASCSSNAFFCFAAIRDMWCCVTWVISCASTDASSDSVCASSMRPVLTPTNPPGSANALIEGSATAKNSKSCRPSTPTATRR
jgi:hypothetical protein